MSDSNYNNTTKLPIPQNAAVSAALTTNVSINSNFPTYANVTGLVASFTTTRANQPVMVSLVCSAKMGGSGTYVGVGYKIDAGSDVGLTFIDRVTVTQGVYANLSCTPILVVVTPGTYSLQIRATSSHACDILGASDAPEAQSTLKIVLL